MFYRPDAEDSPSSSSTDGNESDLEEEETKEMLVNVLFVLRHCDDSVVRSFLTSNATDFFRLLTYCVRVFQYRGSAAVEHLSARIQTQTLKKYDWGGHSGK